MKVTQFPVLYLSFPVDRSKRSPCFFSTWCAADLANFCAQPSVQLAGRYPARTQLVTSGIYAVIRDPSYLGLLVGSLGWDLALRSGVGLLLTALMIPPLLARIRTEERLLGMQFGDECVAYCARTSRLLPGLY